MEGPVTQHYVSNPHRAFFDDDLEPVPTISVWTNLGCVDDEMPQGELGMINVLHACSPANVIFEVRGQALPEP